MWVSEYWCLSLIITVYSHQTLTIISSLFASDHSNMLILSVFLLHPSASINVAAYGMNPKLKTHMGAVGSLAILQLKVLPIFPNILKIKFWVSMPTTSDSDSDPNCYCTHTTHAHVTNHHALLISNSFHSYSNSDGSIESTHAFMTVSYQEMPWLKPKKRPRLPNLPGTLI